MATKQSKEVTISLLQNIVPSFTKLTAEKTVDYDKILKFMEAKQTSQAVERHIAILEKLRKIYTEGIQMKDWKNVAEVIRHVRNKIIAGDKLLFGPLMGLIDMFR
jgi:cilia- and flagella-associated protein 69